MTLLTQLDPPTNAQRIAAYRARLAYADGDVMGQAWRTQRGMRFIQELNTRPSPLLQPEQARRTFPLGAS